MTAIEAVTFDFWNTICVPRPDGAQDRRIALIRETLRRERDHDLSVEEISVAFGHGWDAFHQAWKANEQFHSRDAQAVMLAALGVDDPDGSLAGAIAEEFEAAARANPPDVCPNVVDVLVDLDRRGIRLAVICDVGLTPSSVLATYLDHHGVGDVFDHLSWSDELNAYKPDPTMFLHTLDRLGGVAPGAAAHVGDLSRTDIAGALGVGMTAVRYAGVNDDDRSEPGDPATDDAHHVIRDHAELAEVLALA